MKKTLFSVLATLALIAWVGVTFAANLPVNVYQGGVAVSASAPFNIKYGTGYDPCQNPAIAKSTAAVAATSSSTAYVLAAKSTGKVIYVCEVTGSLSGTTPTIIFSTGTKTTNECDTGNSNLSGTIAPTAGSIVSIGRGGGTIMKGTSGADVCVTTGATSAFNGVISYVQQ